MEESRGERINKYLSDAGACSRREADRRLEAGEVRINDRVAVLGDRVMPEDQVFMNGHLIEKKHEKVLLVYNKPKGVVCTAEKKEKNNIVDVLNYPVRVYPVGRLDKDTTGLILLTNDGDLVNKIMRAGNYHEKEYLVTVNKPLTDEFLRGMAEGVPILDTITRKCRVEKIDSLQFRIILTQGLNRQIRRMCEYFGYRVKDLVRVRIMNIKLGQLENGCYRKATEEEEKELMKLTRNSSSETIKYPKKQDELWKYRDEKEGFEHQQEWKQWRMSNNNDAGKKHGWNQQESTKRDR